MAKEILVGKQLTENMIKAGKELTKKLDNASSQVKAAFWLYLPENQDWKLLFASPLVSSEGPKKFYQRVIEANKLARPDEEVIPLSAVSAMEESDEIVRILKLFMRTTAGISGIRFSRNTINGHYIEDAYIYRLT
jgi:hypothetical protein